MEEDELIYAKDQFDENNLNIYDFKLKRWIIQIFIRFNIYFHCVMIKGVSFQKSFNRD